MDKGFPLLSAGANQQSLPAGVCGGARDVVYDRDLRLVRASARGGRGERFARDLRRMLAPDGISRHAQAGAGRAPLAARAEESARGECALARVHD